MTPRYSGNPAASASCQLGSGMMVVAAASAGMMGDMIDAAREFRDHRYAKAYNDALSRAVEHGRQVQVVAEIAIERVQELEAEVASLRATCQQRQEALDYFRGRA
jgi:hypothetical protein